MINSRVITRKKRLSKKNKRGRLNRFELYRTDDRTTSLSSVERKTRFEIDRGEENISFIEEKFLEKSVDELLRGAILLPVVADK